MEDLAVFLNFHLRSSKQVLQSASSWLEVRPLVLQVLGSLPEVELQVVQEFLASAISEVVAWVVDSLFPNYLAVLTSLLLKLKTLMLYHPSNLVVASLVVEILA